MLRIIMAAIIIAAFSVSSFSQAVRGVQKYVDGKKPLSTDQALNSMADVYTSTDADSVGLVVATKYGTHYRLIQIRNLSGTTQYIKVIVSNTGDTTVHAIPAFSGTGKIAVVRKVISGAVVDSTAYDFQYE